MDVKDIWKRLKTLDVFLVCEELGMAGRCAVQIDEH